MKITLVQTEIELAIREWVGRQLKVADGMSMDIELAATRAAGVGFTATIDIISAAKVSVEPKTLATLGATMFNGSVGSERLPMGSAAGPSEPKAAYQEPDKANVEKAASEPAGETDDQTPPFDTSENVAGTDVQSAEGTPAVQDRDHSETPAPAAPSASRSLFGALKKPKNS